MTVAELTDQFALPGALAFEEHDGLVRAQITLPACSATVYLHGAHLTHWQPAGQAPVLFVSPRSEYAAGKAIRGGIPVCFPWFGSDTQNRAGGRPGPSHGFARIEEWTLAFAALAGEKLHLTFTLGPNELSRSYGFSEFRVAYEMIFSQTLVLRLTVANSGAAPMTFEEALHTYYAVADPRQSPITGLESAVFLDKTDGMKEKTGPAEPLLLDRWTDRVYPANRATAVIHDRGNRRQIMVAKTHSSTTIVWNPYPEATTADLEADSWEHFLCVETANTGEQAITLAPGETHTMQAFVTVEPE